MTSTRFGLLADNDVFFVVGLDETNPVAEKWAAALRSGVELVDTAGYSKIRKGYFYKDGNFFGPTDENMESPITAEDKNYDDTIVFAGVMDNEVIGLMTFVAEDIDPDFYEMIKAGMLSSPRYEEILDENVGVGWVFQNGVFVNPGE